MTKKSLAVFLLTLPFIAYSGLALAMSNTEATKIYAPSNISSYSEEELVALIKKLQNQLEEVRRDKVQCILADVDLSVGDGEDDGLKEYVRALQNFLKEKG